MAEKMNPLERRKKLIEVVMKTQGVDKDTAEQIVESVDREYSEAKVTSPSPQQEQ